MGIAVDRATEKSDDARVFVTYFVNGRLAVANEHCWGRVGFAIPGLSLVSSLAFEKSGERWIVFWDAPLDQLFS
jgi:hypothetical protein